MAITIQSLHVYPIKGLSGTPLNSATVDDRGIAHDRRYGLAYADPTPLMDGTEKWRPWDYFISLKKTTLAATVRASATTDSQGDPSTAILTLQKKNGDTVQGNPSIDAERATLEQFLATALQTPNLRLTDSGSQRLWDDAIALSIVNSATVIDLAASSSQPLEPARFRPNILITGAPAWSEEQWRAQITIGSADSVALTPAGGIPRCAATTVNPQTAERDCKPPALLVKARGHNELGIFATVQRGGTLTTGMELTLEPTA